MLQKISTRRRICTHSAGVLALTCAVPTLAQQSDTTTLEEVIVTAASRIERSGFTAPTPTTVLDSEALENAAITSIGQLSKQIPSFPNESSSPTASTQAFTGVAQTVFSLRGLGSTRTLTLVDGRRHVPTSVSQGLNVDVIPAALVERVEVVTGGASADWGSDAVAGVVNLVLKKDLDGFSGTLQSGTSEHGDHRNILADLAFGTRFADDRGRLSVAGEFYKNEGILSHARRDWGSRQWGLIANPNFAAGNGEYRFVLAPQFQSSSATLGGLILTGAARGTDFGPGGVPRTFVTGEHFNPGSFSPNPAGPVPPGQSMSGGSGIDLGIFVPIELPVERSSVYTRASFDFTDNVTGFFEGSYTEITGEAPTAFAHDAGVIFGAPLRISVNNAFLPESIRSQLVAAGETSFLLGRYSTDFGFISGESTFETKRFVVGLEGDIASWRWNTYYQYGRSEEDARANNNVIQAKLANAVDSVLVGGAPVCSINADATAANDDPACVPINVLGEGSPSAAALDYIHADAQRLAQIDQHVVAFEVQGEPFSIWAGPVSVAAGADFRRDEIEQVSDPISVAGGFFLNTTRSNLSGKIDVIEGFVETVVPLLRDLPLARQIDFNGAARHSAYTVEGPVVIPAPHVESRDFGVTTWKAGLSWSLNEQLRIRFVRSLDIRAANVNELFTLQNQSSANVVWNGVATPVVSFRGGNVRLDPEEGNTTTLGLIYEPAWLAGLRLSVDAYDVDIAGAIANASGTAQQLADACRAGNSAICTLFTFNDAGVPTTLRSQNVNINQLRSKGLDFEASYHIPSSNGGLTLRLLGSYLDELSQTTTIGHTDRAGETGNNNSLQGPEWLINGSVTYDRGPLEIYVAGRWISSGKFDVTFNRDGALDLARNDIPSRFYVNTSAQYELLEDEDRRVQLFGGIDNVLDQDPPVAPQNFQIPLQVGGRFDVIGRAYYLGARFQY